MLSSYILVSLLFFKFVTSDSEHCVTYDFEDGFYEKFISDSCPGTWQHRKYSDIGRPSPNERSTSFITPTAQISCTSSFLFNMHKGGSLEVNVFYNSLSSIDVLRIIVNQKETTGPDKIVGLEEFVTDEESGFHVLKVELGGSESYSGYFTLFGRSFLMSSIYVDSFKYESPHLIDVCTVYGIVSTTEAETTIDDGFATNSTDGGPSTEEILTTDVLTTQHGLTTEAETTDEGSFSTEQGFTTEELTNTDGIFTTVITTSEQALTTEAATTSNVKFTPAESSTIHENSTTDGDLTTDTGSPIDEVTTEKNSTTEQGITTDAITVTDEILTTNVYTTDQGLTTEEAATTTNVDSSTVEIFTPDIESGFTTEAMNESITTEIITTTEEIQTSAVTDVTDTTTTLLPILQNCVTYNFEQSFEEFFGAAGICSRIRVHLFERRQYTASGLESPHVLSTMYISTPTSRTGCIASSPFTMHANGVLQVYMYLNTLTASDQISVLIYKKVSSTKDQVVGTFTTDPRVDRGWNLFNITLTGDESYEGYVAFIGMTSIKSVALVDSFSYIPPNAEASNCIWYDDSTLLTTTFSPIDVNSTTEASQPEEGEDNGCVTYQFGQDFNTLFTSDGVCRFSSNWVIRNYSSLNIESPHEDSVSCIMSSATSSCTTSYTFPMTATGVLEVLVYIEPRLQSDMIDVIVYQIHEQGSTSVVGAGNLSLRYGWNTLKIQLAGNGDYNGQVTFMGRSSTGSILLVDSFRYIPPTLSDENC